MKKVELELLNEEVSLSYNWSAKNLTQQELVIRNTYLNGCGKNEGKIDKNAEEEKKKAKKAKRVTWKIEEEMKRQPSVKQLTS